MSGIADSAFFAAVVDAAVRGTLILLAALGATALMRRSSASARHLVWLAGLSAVLLLPFARVVVPEWRVLPAVPSIAPARAEHGPAVHVPLSHDVPAEVDHPASPVPPEPSAAAASAPAQLRLPVDGRTLALLAWGAGVALLALRLGYGLVRVQWIERRAVELTDDRWVRLTDGLARRLGLGRIVRLLREPGATVPMTWGIFRPVILLPREADGWDDERRRVVLAHELAHVRRWDALTQWIAHLALAVYWFNPLVWVAVRRMREEREHACDDAVLEIGTRPAEYADHLLNIVRSLGSSQGTATAALAMARRSQFEGRLLAILDGAVRRKGVSRAAGLATAAAALACLVPLAALRPAQPVLAETSRTTTETTVEVTADGEAMPAFLHAEIDRTASQAARDTALATAVEALAARNDALAIQRETLAAWRETRSSIAKATGGETDEIASLVLMRVLDREGDPELYAEIIRATLDIHSDIERRLVLMRLLEQPDLSRGNVLAVLDATRTMGSDSDRRLVVIRATEHAAFPRRGPAPDALVEAMRGFGSTSDQRLVLAAMLERGPLDEQALASVLRMVVEVDSDPERRLVLMAAARRQRVQGAARDAYLEAARAIESDSDRAMAISALVDHIAATRRDGLRVNAEVGLAVTGRVAVSPR
jgi:beta-lactamase regulating signal transducer with metallopeptidase domain